MLYNRFVIIIIILLISTQITKAQKVTLSDSLSGQVEYQQKINLNNFVVTSDTLIFNRTKSIFYWNLYASTEDEIQKTKLKYPNAIVKKPKIDFGQVNFLDITKDSMLSRMNMRLIDKEYLLKEIKPKIKWNISDSSKGIGNYTVQKATARFRGRDYTAWFSPEIPVPFGPWKLHGLPGLILEAYDQSGDIYFGAINITFTDVGTIVPIQLNGKEEIITLAEYKEITENFKKYMKTAAFKKVRPYMSQEAANLAIQLPDIKLIETFKDNPDQ